MIKTIFFLNSTDLWNLRNYREFKENKKTLEFKEKRKSMPVEVELKELPWI